MGEMADYYIDLALSSMDFGWEPRLPSPPKGYWRCRDGREIKITDMDTAHLVNCIAYLRRNGRDNIRAFSLMEKELKRRFNVL